MSAKEFWERVLLGPNDECVYHTILPTIFVSRIGTWSQIEAEININDEQVVRAQKHNLLCVQCNTSVGGKLAMLGVRVVIGKYRTGFNTAIFCSGCVRKNRFTNLLDSNAVMHEVMFKKLYGIADEMQIADFSSAEEFLQQILTSFNSKQKEFMYAIGKIDSACGYCRKSNPSQVCSGCWYVRYCNKSCSHADWPRHKDGCKIFMSRSIFYDIRVAK